MGLARRLPLTRQVLAGTIGDGHARADGVHARVDERRDRIPGAFQTRASAQAGRLPPIQGARRLRLDAPALPRRLRAAGPRIPRLRRQQRGRGHVRPARTGKTHLAIALGRQACRQGIPPVSSPPPSSSCACCAPTRRTGSTGSSPRSAGPGSWSSTSSDTSRSTRGQPPAVPGRHHAYERQSIVYTTNIEFSGWGRIFGDPNMPPRSSTAPSTTAG